MSSIVGGFFMIYLAPTGLFSFSTTTVISSKTILTLVMYQLVPELFIDFYVTFMENFGGLRVLHETYCRFRPEIHLFRPRPNTNTLRCL